MNTSVALGRLGNRNSVRGKPGQGRRRDASFVSDSASIDDHLRELARVSSNLASHQEENARKVVLTFNLSTDLEEEKLLLPSAITISNKEQESIYDSLDLVGKGYIGKADVFSLFNQNEDATEAFMENFDVLGNGWISKDEFWGRFHEMLRKVPPLSYSERVYITFDNPKASKLAHWISVGIMLLILISSLNFILETSPTFKVEDPDDPTAEPTPYAEFFYVECICIAAFTVEYVCRLLTVAFVRSENSLVMTLNVISDKFITVTAGGKQVFHSLHGVISEPEADPLARLMEKTPFQKFLGFLLDIMNFVDFIAIGPFYLELLMGPSGAGDLGFFRIMRLARVFRIFKMGKYSQGLQLFAQVILLSLPALYILGFFIVLGTVLFGSMIYFCEAGTWTVNEQFPDGAYVRPDIHDEDEKTPFTSIPNSFWWVLVTSTTVGYGDYFPTTPLGKIVGSICVLSGVLVLALPITIIGANFANEYANMEEEKHKKEEEARLREYRHKSWRTGRHDRLLLEGVITEKDIPPETQKSWKELAKSPQWQKELKRLIEHPEEFDSTQEEDVPVQPPPTVRKMGSKAIVAKKLKHQQSFGSIAKTVWSNNEWDKKRRSFLVDEEPPAVGVFEALVVENECVDGMAGQLDSVIERELAAWDFQFEQTKQHMESEIEEWAKSVEDSREQLKIRLKKAVAFMTSQPRQADSVRDTRPGSLTTQVEEIDEEVSPHIRPSDAKESMLPGSANHLTEKITEKVLAEESMGTTQHLVGTDELYSKG